MSKKSTIILIIIGIAVILTATVLYILNLKGYVKIFGSTNYYQKIEVISSNWSVNSGSDKIDFSSGKMKLSSATTQGQAQDTSSSNYLSQCCGGGCGTNCQFTQSITGNHEFYLPANTYSVDLRDIAADDYFTSLIVNNNTIIGGTEKYHPNTDITSLMNLTGLNRITVRVIDTAGGAIGYHMNVVGYQHGQMLAPTTTFDNSGYYITKKIGSDDVNSFDKIVIKGENKLSGTDIYYQVRYSATNNFDPAEVYKCASNTIGINTAQACVEETYKPTNGEIDLKNIIKKTGIHYLTVKAVLTSTDGVNTPSFDGMDVYYTTKEVLPNYIIMPKFSYQSKSTVQSKMVKISVTNIGKESKYKGTITLNDSNSGSITLGDNVNGDLVFYVKGAKHLSRKAQKVINANSDLEFSQFLAGDLNDDDIVNSLDWSLMNKYWQQTSNDNDLTGDGVINSLDWSIMNANWGKKGDALVDNISF